MSAEIPYRDLGSTGERVACIGLGGWHLSIPGVDKELATRIVRTAIDGERAASLAKTRETAAKGDYELFKTRSIFDSTAKNPEWLGEEPERISELMPA